MRRLLYTIFTYVFYGFFLVPSKAKDNYAFYIPGRSLTGNSGAHFPQKQRPAEPPGLSQRRQVQRVYRNAERNY
jgi:hypothetical protein